MYGEAFGAAGAVALVVFDDLGGAEDGVDVLDYGGGLGLEGGEVEVGEAVEAFGFAGGDEGADDVVGGAEGDAFLDEVFGHDGGVGEAFVEAGGDALGEEFGVEDDGCGHGEGGVDGVVGEEDVAFVFLHVAVVGEGLAFHHGEEGDELAVDAAGFAADEFEPVGVAFLGHHGGAGGEGVADLHVAELGGDVEDPLFGPAGEVQMAIMEKVEERVRRGNREFGDGIEGVVGNGGHAEEVGGFFTVDGEGGRRRITPEALRRRGDVDAFEGSRRGVALAPRLEHFAPGEHFVSGDDGLGALQVGEGGHGGEALVFGHFDEGALEVADFGGEEADGFAAPESDVEGDLVVAGAGGVEFFAGLADALDEGGFDGHVDVFLGDIKFEGAGFDVAEDVEESALDGGEVFFGQEADGFEHGGVGDGAEDVVLGEAVVEGEGFDELDGEGVLGFADAGLPGFFGGGGGGGGFGGGFHAKSPCSMGEEGEV